MFKSKLVGILVSLISAASVTAQTYNLSRDFSLSSNPHGAWSYGYSSSVGTAFSHFVSRGTNYTDEGVPIVLWSISPSAVPAVLHNATSQTGTSDGGQAVYTPGVVYYYPGVSAVGIIRLTIPVGGDGTYVVRASVSPVYNLTQGDTDFHVLRNGNQVFVTNLAGQATSQYSNRWLLSAGNTIDLVIGRGADNALDYSGLKVQAIVERVPTPPPLPSNTFDLSRDFSLASNPNGPWSYGYQNNLGGAFNLLSSGQIVTAGNGVPIEYWAFTPNQGPAVFHNNTTSTATSDGGQGVYPPETTWFQAGEIGAAQNFGVIRLTIPAGQGGTYRLESAVRAHLDGSSSGDNDYHVLRNGVSRHGQVVAANSSGGYSNTVGLAAGDTLDFVVGRGPDGLTSALKIRATVNLISTNLPPPPPPSNTFDLSRDFSLASNPNGPWSYGYENNLGGVFNLLSSGQTTTAGNGVPIEYWAFTPNQGPAVFHNNTTSTATSDGGQGVYPPETTWFQAGEIGAAQNFGVIRLTIPAGQGGTYRLESAVRPTLDGPSAPDSDYHVFRNGVSLHGQVVAANTSGGYSNMVGLAAGDTIDFVVGRGPDGMSAALKIRATVNLISTNLPTPPLDYDLSRDYAFVNPSGPWSYGWKTVLTGEFNLMSRSNINIAGNGVPIERWSKYPASAPEILHNSTSSTATTDAGQGNYPPGTTWYFPGVEGSIENFSAIRFTVPLGKEGVYSLVVAARPAFNGSTQGDTDFHIIHSGTELFGQALAAGASAGYSNTIALAVGDTIDFAIGRGADGSFHGSGLKITATLDLVSTNLPPPPPPPVCITPVAGLVSWWPLDGSGADVASENSGTLVGNPVFGAGKVRQAMLADGRDDEVRIPAASSLDVGTGQGLSIEGWINPSDVSVQRPIVEWNNHQIAGAHFWISVGPTIGNGPGSLYANLIDTGNNSHVIASASGIITTGSWQHVAVTYDKASGIATLYLNGTVVAQQNLGTFTAQTTFDLFLGRRIALPGYEAWFAGGLDEISLYNRALTASELAGIYAASGAGKCPLPPNGSPVAKAVVSPVVDLSPKLTELLVISVNGSNAPVALDGSQSSDPDGDALTYRWFANDDPQPIATGVADAVALGLGSHAITLVVSDGRASARDTVEVEVVTIEEVIGILIVLVDESGLPRRNQRTLIQVLKQADHAIDRDRLRTAIRKLETFQEKVAAQVTRINPECAEALIDAAQKVIDALGTPPPQPRNHDNDDD